MINFRNFIILVVTHYALFASNVYAGQGHNDLVEWNSVQGIQRVAESQYKKDFFQLANHFQSQPNGVVCGPTTGSIILNALRLKKKDKRLPYTSADPRNTEYMPLGADLRIRMYRPNNFMSALTERIKTRDEIFGKPIDGKRDFGLQIRQLHKMFVAHGTQSKLRVVDDSYSLDKMRAEFISNLKSKDDFIVVNYARKILGQNGPGHISPVGAYHKATDSFLIMDVTSYDHSWVWAPAKKLFKAMQSFDTVENRGYLLIQDQPAALL